MEMRGRGGTGFHSPYPGHLKVVFLRTLLGDTASEKHASAHDKHSFIETGRKQP